jgi:hypothetical protein
MALPTTAKDLEPLHKEILSFLWTRTANTETIQKRRLVASKRIAASFNKGGLQIQPPAEAAEGLRLNLIQKCHRKIEAGQPTMLVDILEQVLRDKRRPSLSTHINSLGPTERNITGDKIMMKNQMLGLAFKSMALYLVTLEDSPEDWHLAPVRGHTRIHKLYPLYPADLATLEVHGITTVSQLFETHLSGRIDKTISNELLTSLTRYPMLQHKLRLLTQALLHQPFHNKYASPRTNLAALAPIDTNLSRRYHLKCREILDTSIGVAPPHYGTTLELEPPGEAGQ